MHSLLAEQVPAERLRSTTDHAELSSADIILVAVQTPIDLCSKAPALDALRDAVASVGSHVRPGVLVIVESTVPPGTMRDLVVPLLERTAGLSADGDFLAGCCPERVMPGKLLANLRGCSRVMGGWTADAGRVGSALPYVDWRRDRRDGLYDGGVGMPRHVGQLAQNLLAGCGRRLSDARVVVLGYAYLEDSDDARNSPSADLVAWLERRGASVTVHDPLVAPFDVDLAQATRGADCLISMVAHSAYRWLDLAQLGQQMRTRILIDGRRLFVPQSATSAGFAYRCVGIAETTRTRRPPLAASALEQAERNAREPFDGAGLASEPDARVGRGAVRVAWLPRRRSGGLRDSGRLQGRALVGVAASRLYSAGGRGRRAAGGPGGRPNAACAGCSAPGGRAVRNLPAVSAVDKVDAFVEEILRGFLALTLLACAAPTFLLRSRRDIYQFLTATCLGVFVAFNALYWFLTDPSRFERLGVETPISTIVVGQMVGLAAVWVTLLAVNRRLNFLLALGTVALLSSVLIGVGSRGLLLVIVLPETLVVLFYGRSPSAAARCVAIGLVALLGLQIGLSMAPDSATSRVESFLLGEPDTSAEVRIEYAALTVDAIQVNPLGLGLAGFSSKIVPWVTGTGPYAREYPHNVFLEAFVDSGWLAGLTLLLIFGAAVLRCWRFAVHSRLGVEYTRLLVILLYPALEGTVSGTMSESRMLFALFGTALSLSSSDGRA